VHLVPSTSSLLRPVKTNTPQRPFYLDFFQLLRFITLTLMTAPPNYHWQQFLERSFPAHISPSSQGSEGAGIELKLSKPGETSPALLEDGTSSASSDLKFSLKNTLTKWFVDCITLGAIMNTIGFLVLMGGMKGQGLGQIWYNIKTVRVSSGTDSDAKTNSL